MARFPYVLTSSGFCTSKFLSLSNGQYPVVSTWSELHTFECACHSTSSRTCKRSTIWHFATRNITRLPCNLWHHFRLILWWREQWLRSPDNVTFIDRVEEGYWERPNRCGICEEGYHQTTWSENAKHEETRDDETIYSLKMRWESIPSNRKQKLWCRWRHNGCYHGDHDVHTVAMTTVTTLAKPLGTYAVCSNHGNKNNSWRVVVLATLEKR